MTRRVVQRSPKVSAAVTLPEPQASWAYFFDIDGTLVDIAPTPWDVRLERELLDLLLRLHAATGRSGGR